MVWIYGWSLCKKIFDLTLFWLHRNVPLLSQGRDVCEADRVRLHSHALHEIDFFELIFNVVSLMPFNVRPSVEMLTEKTHLPPADYLAFERQSEARHEYDGGELRLMASILPSLLSFMLAGVELTIVQLKFF